MMRIPIVHFVLVLETILFTCYAMASRRCEFPSSIRTNVTGRDWSRDWQGRIKDQFTQFTMKIEITHNIIRTVSNDASVKSNNRLCLHLVDENTFLVMHEESGQSGPKYSCLQFIFRSSNVFQIRSSPPGDSMNPSDVCREEVLQLDKWLVVDKGRIERDGHGSCSLEGGFNIIVFDKARREGVCDAWRGEIRMESECFHGDGLTFYFRSQRCVPEGMYMYARQETFCLASWNESGYTFTLIRHNIFNYMWLLRFPTNRENTFSTTLFKDLFADTANIINETYSFLRFDTFREDPYDLTTLCRDEYEICTRRRAPCSSDGEQLALACPMACGICNRTSAELCNVNPNWTGVWRDGGKAARMVSVNNTTLTVSRGEGGSEDFHCVNWKSVSDVEITGKPASAGRMFVTEYSNGCRPRYTCARMLTQTPLLLHLELSRSKMWPLIKSPNDLISCDGFSFEPPNQHLLLHAPGKSEDSVECGLPTEALETFQIRLHSGGECAGNLSTTTGGTGFHMNLIGCQMDSSIEEKSFICLDSSKVGSAQNIVIVTKTTQNSSMHCWQFPRNQPTILYLVEGANCHLAFKNNSRLQSSQYLLHGTRILRSTTIAVIGKVRSSSGRSNSNTTHLPQVTSSRAERKSSEEIFIQPSTEQEELPSPNIFVAAAVAVVFAILKAVVLCF